MQVVIFTLNDEEFAIETSRVVSISDNMEITKIPKAPSYIKGLINLRGNVISLLDLSLLVNIDNSGEQKNIIIINIDDEEVGITVDNVNEVLDIDESIIERVEVGNNKQYTKGILNFKNKIVMLIDIDKLLPNY